MKTTIKRLSREIDRILDKTEEANYYDGLIDGGEWSQQGPDFSDLIKRWKLTREQLILYCNMASEYGSIWFEKYPATKANLKPWDCLEDRNPWKHIQQNLECIFMAGELQESDSYMSKGFFTPATNKRAVTKKIKLLIAIIGVLLLTSCAATFPVREPNDLMPFGYPDDRSLNWNRFDY